MATQALTVQGITVAQLNRLAELSELLRRRDEAMEARRAREDAARELRKTAADRAFGAWLARQPSSRPRTIGAAYAASLLRIPVAALLAATAGQPFRIDFGRSGTGDELTFFERLKLVAWAKRAAKGVKVRPEAAAKAKAA